LSPELALVDPDLAQRARRRLTAEWHEAALERERAATAEGPAEAAPVDVRAADYNAVASPSPAPNRRAVRPERTDAPLVPAGGSRERGRRRGRTLALAAAALVAGGAAYVIASPSRIDGWLSRDKPIRSSGRSIDETGDRSTGKTSTPATISTTGTTDTSARSSTSTSSPTTAPPPQRDREGHARAFGWPPVAHAKSYVVEFYRGGAKIYAARRSKPSLTLPPQWTFRGHRYRLTAGRYRWRVRAVFPQGRAKVIVRATLHVRGSG
jgi:hypothetical protein